jgi:hypothetical protein
MFTNAPVDKNVNMYVGDNILDDPVIKEFISLIPDWFDETLYVVKISIVTLVIWITYGYALCLFGLLVTTFWPLFQEWIEVICAVISIATTVTFLKWIHDDTEMADQYIIKLKAELAAKDAIIAELKKASLVNLKNNDSASASASESETEYLKYE